MTTINSVTCYPFTCKGCNGNYDWYYNYNSILCSLCQLSVKRAIMKNYGWKGEDSLSQVIVDYCKLFPGTLIMSTEQFDKVLEHLTNNLNEVEWASFFLGFDLDESLSFWLEGDYIFTSVQSEQIINLIRSRVPKESQHKFIAALGVRLNTTVEVLCIRYLRIVLKK